MSAASARLAALGLTLPDVVPPVAAYVPALVHGDMAWSSGQLPMREGELLATGALSSDDDVERGYSAARQCALNAVAAIAAVSGGIDKIERIIKVTGFVASTPEFTGQPRVINGASELLGEIFGDAGAHARSAVGVAALPMGASVEVEVQVALKRS